jgi:hypothetical protein
LRHVARSQRHVSKNCVFATFPCNFATFCDMSYVSAICCTMSFCPCDSLRHVSFFATWCHNSILGLCWHLAMSSNCLWAIASKTCSALSSEGFGDFLRMSYCSLPTSHLFSLCTQNTSCAGVHWECCTCDGARQLPPLYQPWKEKWGQHRQFQQLCSA